MAERILAHNFPDKEILRSRCIDSGLMKQIRYNRDILVTLAQLAERGVVVLDVMGSSPICHPLRAIQLPDIQAGNFISRNLKCPKGSKFAPYCRVKQRVDG